MTRKDIAREIDFVDSIMRTHFNDYGEETHRALQEAIKLIKQEQKTEWIPVSEKLPDKNMACLVTVGELNLVKIVMYSDLMGTIDHKIFRIGDYGKENFENITKYVKAWMPLPEPYKESEG